MTDTQARFAHRRRILTARPDAMDLAARLRRCLASAEAGDLRETLNRQHPADLADAMIYLTEAEDLALFRLLETLEAAEVLDEVDPTTRRRLVEVTAPERLARIVEELPADEAADVLGALEPARREETLKQMTAEAAQPVRELLAWPADSAGGLMSLGFVQVPDTALQADAIQLFRQMRRAEALFYIFVVNSAGILSGFVDLRTLFSAAPETPVLSLMSTDFISVPVMCDREQVAAIFARYDLTALPVVAAQPDGKLLGVITADDVIDVIRKEADEDVAQMSGSDAQELENKTPAQVARLRMPWIMATMFIELFAGLVIHLFDATLTKYILLASFMPIISAISGNTGLQSAAIIIRGLSTGHVQLAHWKHAVVRQLSTTLILGGTCAVTLGIIGGVWDRSFAFGLSVMLGMFLAVNIAGVVGTIVPLMSKRAGYDPALTAGPFETAFQDVIGISIFLSLATLLLRWMR